jgi:DNA-binding MarR family transcriptional regulator
MERRWQVNSGKTPETTAGRRRSLTEEAKRALGERFPHLDSEASTLGIALTRAAHAHSTISDDVVHRAHSRNWLVFRVLYVIWVFAPVSARDVVEAMQLSRQTVSNTLRALEAEGMITRTRDTQDARLMTIELTAEGRKSMETALEEQFQLDSVIFEVLSADERKQLRSLLDRVRGRIVQLEQDSAEPGEDARLA